VQSLLPTGNKVVTGEKRRSKEKSTSSRMFPLTEKIIFAKR